MLDRREEEEEEKSGLLFSPQPKAEPEMLGARNVDSVLFDVAQMQQAARDMAAKREAEEKGSGLVDINELIDPAAVPDDPEAPLVEPAAVLVEQIKARPELPESTHRDPRGLVIAVIVLASLLLATLAYIAIRGGALS
jgi:hypothetical protein